MTGQEWMTCDDPAAMLEYVGRGCDPTGLTAPTVRVSDRKLRLWVEACRDHEVRRNPYANYHLPGGGYNLETPTGLADAVGAWTRRTTDIVPIPVRCQALRDIIGNPFQLLTDQDVWDNLDSVESQTLCMHMASDIYDNRRWDLMPVLADCLAESGCTNEDILMHLRGMERCLDCLQCPGSNNLPENGFGRTTCKTCNGIGWITLRGPHVRGCHVLDLILGKV